MAALKGEKTRLLEQTRSHSAGHLPVPPPSDAQEGLRTTGVGGEGSNTEQRIQRVKPSAGLTAPKGETHSPFSF